ncbi:MAG: hypothetical protein WBG66_16115 [Geitlerinemataceae cyanobacterium]
MYAYHAYNLSIHSEFPLPELLPDDQPADVVVRFGKLDNPDRRSNGGDYFLGSVEGLGRLLVREGCEIVLDPEAGVEESVLRPVVLGPLFSMLMRQRGFLVLHASTVAIDGVAVAFMTHSGGGKSTMADAFHSQGYSLLTDDVMAIDLSGEEPMVIPSFPQVKLLPDAATAIGHDIDSLPLLHPQSPKFAHQLSEGFLQTPLPLKQLYVLEVGTHPEIVPLNPQTSFVELVRNSRAVALLTAPEFSSNHLHQCTRLFQQVPISALKRQRNLAALPDVVKLVTDAIVPSPCHA